MQNTVAATAEMTEMEARINNGVAYLDDGKLSVEEQVELVKVLSTPRPLTDTMKRALEKELKRMQEKKNARI